MENLNGHKLVEAEDLCERRNRKGVDLNRNRSVDWGKKEDFNPEENPGTAPFSEPETQIKQRLSKSFSPHLWVNVHPGMEALFMPYDHRNTTPNGLAIDMMRSMSEELNHHHCHDRCLVGSRGGSVGFIYGDLNASSKDCFKMFNLDDADTFYVCNLVLGKQSISYLLLMDTNNFVVICLPERRATPSQNGDFVNVIHGQFHDVCAL
ncbi:hypothetical protein H6P81_005982 [Aristolochia fimbriata]|uniref:Peptidase M14 domain-containing protein n=1 Tax=Aristolochia fimbriata TaxID=158543 RepID=A0AAV7F0M9_ARIFI|nr:hypothetical protein H6P81_005982 [Aristolochia fimbriata]